MIFSFYAQKFFHDTIIPYFKITFQRDLKYLGILDRKFYFLDKSVIITPAKRYTLFSRSQSEKMHSAFLIPHSVFRISHSAFRISHFAFRIPHFSPPLDFF